MLDYNAIASIAITCPTGDISPGPNFVALTHRAIASSRPETFVMALGIAMVNALWAAVAFFDLDC